MMQHPTQKQPLPRHSQHITHALPQDGFAPGPNRPFLAPWSRKRGLVAETEADDSILKKRNKNEHDGQGLFGWNGLLEAAKSSPAPGSPYSSSESDQGYFDRRSTLATPATPPRDAGAPTGESQGQFLVSSSQQPANSTSLYTPGREPRSTHPLAEKALGHQFDMDVESPWREQYTIHNSLSALRSISPAPSSPGESVDEMEGHGAYQGHGEDDGLNTVSRVFTPPVSEATFIDPGTRKASNGRPSFVMGFRADCEKCQRRERGHFAHFN
ncbi:hypothetical protein BGZ67_009006 [Mortierella alpina]|nr:hypothetical protein BGZ67_009006 [Mortierella alpina]